MKQPQNMDEYLTKQDLYEAFEEFEKRFLKRFEQVEIHLEAKMAIKFEDFEHRMDDKFRQYTSEVLTRFDAVVKQLRDARVDQSVITAKINGNQLILKDHEKRIAKLEPKKN